MRTSAALMAFAAASAVSAQVANYTSSLNMTIDPNSVTAQERASWCQAQTNTCNTLCDQDTNSNACVQGELSYDCTCSSNNSAPGLQYYTQTLPTFICNELFSQCISQNVGSQNGQDDCKENIQDLCGTLDPADAETSSDDDTTTASSANTASATATTTSSSSGSNATGSAVTSTSSGGLAAPTMAPVGKGAAALAIGLVAYLV